MVSEKKLEAPQNLPNLVENTDASNLDAGLVMSKVSETVGEAPAESIPQSSGKKDNSHQKKDASLAGKIFQLLKPTKKKVSKKLPPLVIQKQKTRKAIAKATNNLIKEAQKVENSPNFSAEKLEKIILKIRRLQKILADMFQYTSSQVEDLYRKFVMKEGA